MIKKSILTVQFLAVLPWMAWAQDAKTIVSNAAKAMGVSDLGAIGSYMYSGTGTTFEFGVARKPNAPWPKSSAGSFRRVIDFYAGGSMEVITPAQEVGPQQSEVLRIPFREHYGKPGKQYEIWITPLAFLNAAALASSDVKLAVLAGKEYTAISFRQERYEFTGYVNSDNRLERVETRVDNPVLGDMLIESTYSDYKDFQHGLIFPSKILEKQGGYPVRDLTITNAVRNVIETVIEPVRHFDRGIGDPHYHGEFMGAPPPIVVDEVLFGDGVYYLRFKEDEDDKEIYHSIVVEFNDYLVLIEAPLGEAYSNVALKEIRSLFGSKPIRYVVNTHAHFDAAGGLRTYAAQGAIILTQEINKPYFEKVFAQPHTITPDKLSLAKKKAVIEGVAEKRVLTDGTHIIELYRVRNESSDGMLVAFLPKEKILVEADLYAVPEPGNVITENGEVVPKTKPPVTPYAAAFANTLEHMKLDYKTILALTGRIASKEELLEDLKAASPR